jgi:hypothetical protein
VKIAVELSAGAVAPGEHVHGHVVVQEGGEVQALELALVFVEHTDHFEHVVAGAPVLELSGGGRELGDGERLAFAVALPEGAAPAIVTPRGRLGWELRARARRRGIDARAERVLDVRAVTTP